MQELLALLKNQGLPRSKDIVDALSHVDRKDFVTSEHLGEAYADVALPIGGGQTISQPYTVVFMLELLQAKEGDNIFEIGYGSGWQTALLAHIVGNGGKVYAAELVEELCEFGKANVSRYDALFKRVEWYCQNAAPGLPDIAASIGGFDAIIAAAEVREVPPAWREQLKAGGCLVYPKNGSIFREVKQAADELDIHEYPGFSFVRFVE